MMQPILVTDMREAGREFKTYLHPVRLIGLGILKPSAYFCHDMLYSVETGMAHGAERLYLVRPLLARRVQQSILIHKVSWLAILCLPAYMMKIAPLALAIVIEGQIVDTSSMAGEIFQAMSKLMMWEDHK